MSLSVRAVHVSIEADIGSAGVTARRIREAVKAARPSDTIRVLINSRGGDAFAAMAIHDMFRAAPQRVEVLIEGIAASAASLVAMAGDTIRMSANSFMMIHGPWSEVQGGSHALRGMADRLVQVGAQMAGIYSARSHLSVDAVLRLMEEETWFDAKSAVEHGLADEVTPAVRVAAMDLSAFRHPPQATMLTDSEIAAVWTRWNRVAS